MGNLLDYIKKEFPKNALDIDFKIVDVYEDLEKIEKHILESIDLERNILYRRLKEESVK